MLENYNFFVAKWENQCTNKGCKENNYGFIELSEASISFEKFKKNALNQDKLYAASGTQNYTTSAGDEISFEINPRRRFQSPIISVNDDFVDRDMRKWPAASGDIMNIENDIITVKSPSTDKTFTIDYSNQRNPIIR